MDLIKQRTNSDCGVACIAMVIGCTYEEAYECYDEKLNCAHTASMERFLNKHSLSIYARNQNKDEDCVAYLMLCRSPSGAHWVVFTINGKILDPSPTPLQEFQNINLFPIKPKS